MKRYILALLTCIVGHCALNAQSTIIHKDFHMSAYNRTTNQFQDSIFKTTFKIDKGKVVLVNIHLAFLDKYAKDAWIRFDGKNASSYQGFVTSLKAIRNKFRRWIEISKANNVKSYSKELKDDIPPIPKVDIYFQYDEGDFYVTPNYSGPTMGFVPMFFVNDDGKPDLEMAFARVNAYRYKRPEGYVPSLWSAIITSATHADQEGRKFVNFGLYFDTVDQIQSLIDALDITKELQEFSNKASEEKQRKEEIDNLFK